MVNKPGWLEDSVAKADGYYSPKGEKLKGEILTTDQIAEWNGKTPKAEMLIEAPISADDLNEMTKVELEELGREHGIELDRREKKSSLLSQLKVVLP